MCLILELGTLRDFDLDFGLILFRAARLGYVNLILFFVALCERIILGIFRGPFHFVVASSLISSFIG